MDDNLHLVNGGGELFKRTCFFFKKMQKQKCSAPDKNDVLLPVDWKGGKPDVRKILGKFFFFPVPFLVLF